MRTQGQSHKPHLFMHIFLREPEFSCVFDFMLLALTTVEFDLLEKLMRSAGSVVGRDELTRNVLGREFSPFDRSIDTHIWSLRPL